MKATLMNPFSWIVNPANIENANLIAVHMNGKILWVSAREITHLEGEGNYTYIHTRQGKKHLVSKTLKVVMEILNVEFIRIHKSYIVNPMYVTAQIEPDTLLLSCGRKVPIARRRMREIQEMLVGEYAAA
ncbi:LytR/AlgR family response regulator transcription factor [Dyadobacter fanqingshengii]|uniref:LytTR family transcriptional regulator n=1 Tax=Dyadobacter fanqingshengii TaxID=2906443 RepID=A0A9X1P690_9BACT|nr:LytTR family DNA-binding domain-containing protein [Dyadobacter fanqingshengii]MCF0038740.1 LytTR family transcriptional regulator [Dyadobacter fanqingshengii]MCF2503715.1 LytTR family transcriptional regulator [Dyadobacter fanqingshengii]USJ34430.1 LytTR family transcriptional regulator [Dyadobacter fanqingshengii]